jgi:hypothetical protein
MDATLTPNQEGQAPPPYSLVPLDEQPASSSSQLQFHPSSLTSHLHSHLSALPDRIRQTQQAHSTQQTQTDIWILDHLVPVIESFLADLGARHTAPHLATLTLVPNSAIPPDAELSGMEDMLQRKEVSRVFRVDVMEEGQGKGGGDSKGGAAAAARSEFTDWGRWEEPGSMAQGPPELLWWKNEAMARRLASYLQPLAKPKPRPAVQSPVQAAVEQRIPAEKAKKNWGWGRWRGDQAPEASPAASAAGSQGARGTVEGGDIAGVPTRGVVVDDERRAEMDVTTEKVAFRRENDFGIWESMSGWAIIVAVKVRSQ